MRNRLIPLAGCLCLFAASAMAQTPPHSIPNDPLKLVTKSEWTGMLATPNSTGIATAFLSDHEDFFLEVVRRVKSGDAEQHNHWNDYFVVTDGAATLLYGTPDPAVTANANGEGRPPSLIGTSAARVEMHPGDVVTIPAGIPHQVVLAPGTKEFNYLVFKKRV